MSSARTYAEQSREHDNEARSDDHYCSEATSREDETRSEATVIIDASFVPHGRSAFSLSCLHLTIRLDNDNRYYQSDELTSQANGLLAMVSLNMCCQLFVVITQYKDKSISVKIQEALICLLFLRPAVDAYRVSTNHQDDEANFPAIT